MNYNIIATGSQGNAVILNNSILVDCGVPFKAIDQYANNLKLVLLTHIHSDHFNKSTLRALARYRPALRFGCGHWLVEPLLGCGVSAKCIDVLDGNCYSYEFADILPVLLSHNVPNIGYKIHFADGQKVIYATDTNNLNGISAKNYDLYLIEANYNECEIKKRIEEKAARNEYSYEMQVIHNHLSREKCDDFIFKNIGMSGTYVYMHCHKDLPTKYPEE